MTTGTGLQGTRMSARSMAVGRVFGVVTAIVLMSACIPVVRERVECGAEYLRKTVFLADRELLAAESITVGELDPHPGLEVGIVGRHGAWLASTDGAVFRRVPGARASLGRGRGCAPSGWPRRGRARRGG